MRKVLLLGGLQNVIKALLPDYLSWEIFIARRV
jgi:hypothetical protein